MRTAACEAESQKTAPNNSETAPKQQWGKVNIYGFGEGGGSIPLSTHFTKDVLLVTRILCHHEGI